MRRPTATQRYGTQPEHDAWRLRECRRLAVLSYLGCVAAVLLHPWAVGLADRAATGDDTWAGLGAAVVLVASPLWLVPAGLLLLTTLIVSRASTAAGLTMTIAVGSALLSLPLVGGGLARAHGDPAASAALLLDGCLVWIPMVIVIARDADA